MEGGRKGMVVMHIFFIRSLFQITPSCSFTPCHTRCRVCFRILLKGKQTVHTEFTQHKLYSMSSARTRFLLSLFHRQRLLYLTLPSSNNKPMII